MVLFDGNSQAIEREARLIGQVEQIKALSGHTAVISAVLFREDSGSQLYTRLKREAAERVGIEYRSVEFSLTTDPKVVTATIAELNSDPSVTGIIVQKPWRRLWLAAHGAKNEGAPTTSQEYQQWWHTIMSAVDPAKDVDGLHPQTLAAVQAGTWEKDGCVLPATCQAVLFALDETKRALNTSDLGKTIIIGRSDLLGIPLEAVLRHQGGSVELIGVKELAERTESGQLLLDGQVVVSATGQRHVVTGAMVREGVVLIDVGEPQPDIERASVEAKAAFLTPVPGGIGPLTVSFLLENAMILASKCR